MNIINLDNCKNYLQIQVGDEIHDVKLVETSDEPWFCGKDVVIFWSIVILNRHYKIM